MPKIISVSGGNKILIDTINVSNGVSDKVVSTNNAGKIDSSFLPATGVGGARVYGELLNVTALNSLSNLSFTPDYTYNVQLIVNGKNESTFNNVFSVSGKIITWNAANAGYSLDPSFEVVARYTTTDG